MTSQGLRGRGTGNISSYSSSSTLFTGQDQAIRNDFLSLRVCTIEIMASNNSQVGKWEVVKKSKKPGTAGSGGKNPGEKKAGRKALSESNMTRIDQLRKLTWLATHVSHC